MKWSVIEEKDVLSHAMFDTPPKEEKKFLVHWMREDILNKENNSAAIVETYEHVRYSDLTTCIVSVLEAHLFEKDLDYVEVHAEF